MNAQTIENLLLNHQLRFSHDAAVTEAANLAHKAMFQSVRSPMEQGLINLAWKTYFNLQLTEDDFEVITAFNQGV